MARARNIKPGVFKNEDLVELPFEDRLLFMGLWTLADRRGRLEDRPRRIKMEIFPADDVDVEAALGRLASTGMITRYEVRDCRVIAIPAFLKHQRPHQNEAESILPDEDGLFPGEEQTCDHGEQPDEPEGEALRSESLNPSSLNPDPGIPNDEPEGTDAGASEGGEAPPDDVREVFDHWVNATGRTAGKVRLTDDRRRKIQARLKEYPKTDLMAAIDGCMRSPFHQGQNDQGRKYDGIELIFRNGEKIEQFRDMPPSPSPPAGNHNGFSGREYTEHIPDWAKED